MTYETTQQRADEFEELARALQEHAARLRSQANKQETRPNRLFWQKNIAQFEKAAEILI